MGGLCWTVSGIVLLEAKRRAMIRRFHNSVFAGHLGISRTVFRQTFRPECIGQDCGMMFGHIYSELRTRKSQCPRRAPMGHVAEGRRWERVAMDLLDMSVTSSKGNRYVLVMVDCFSRWTEACPLSDKTAISVADAFFSNIVCRFGMPSVIQSGTRVRK